MFRLRFPKSKVLLWASKYDHRQDDKVFLSISSAVKRHGHLQRNEFLEVCRWKSPRSQSHCADNGAKVIEAVTGFALAPRTPDRLKIEVLTML